MGLVHLLLVLIVEQLVGDSLLESTVELHTAELLIFHFNVGWCYSLFLGAIFN